MYMSGSSLNIFSIMITGMALMNPIKAILNSGQIFNQIKLQVPGVNLDVQTPRLMYIGIQLLGLALGLYKCGTMGLLPLASSDWISMLGVSVPAEVMIIGGD